jgi:hypothetical protein
VGIPEGNKPFVGPRNNLEENNKMDLREVGWEIMDWIDLAEDRNRCRALVNAAMNLRVP